MAYLRDYDWDVFISYSHIDNRPFLPKEKPRSSSWVDLFVHALQTSIDRQFGLRETVSIWHDKRVGATDLISPTVTDACSRSAILLCITSPSYLESPWCQHEYEAFCAANGNRQPPSHGNHSRVFNVRLWKISRQSHLSKYEHRFADTIGYEFYDPESGLPLWPKERGDLHRIYWTRVIDLARAIFNLLRTMKQVGTSLDETVLRYVLCVEGREEKNRIEQAIPLLKTISQDPSLVSIQCVTGIQATQLILRGTRSGFRRLAQPCHHSELPFRVTTVYPADLDAILLQAKESLVVHGHTMNRFTHDDRIQKSLQRVLSRGVSVTFLLLNPKSKSSEAHLPYHEFESATPPNKQFDAALHFCRTLFRSLKDQQLHEKFEVLLNNYMPKFRVIQVDDTIYCYLYAYGTDVSDYPDFVLQGNARSTLDVGSPVEGSFTRIVASITALTSAPETIPYIRDGRIYEYWAKSYLATWDYWKSAVRHRHRITHQYYVTRAEQFHERFGHNRELEPYVKAHLDLLSGRTLVLGCGSGKEVDYLDRCGRCGELYGIDFSPEAIRLARSSRPHLAEKFIVEDFYDLDHVLEGSFDSIAANAALVHLFEREDMKKILKKIERRLRIGGICFIRNLYKEEKGKRLMDEHVMKDRFDAPRWFVYYSRQELADLAAAAGLQTDHQATGLVAESAVKEDDALGAVEEIMTKGFLHQQFPGVYWPCVILVKTGKPIRQKAVQASG